MLIEIAKYKAGSEVCELNYLTGCGNMADQTDHCHSASKAIALRFDHRNLTRLCGCCHSKKSYQIDGVEKLVDQHVRSREGARNWLKMMNMAKIRASEFRWGLPELEELEKQVKELVEYYAVRLD